MVTFDAFQTVPMITQRDMDPYMQIAAKDHSFPLPGEDFTFVRLDLSKALIKNPASTFFVRASEDHMSETGISKGDILIVDREAEPRHNATILAFVEGEFLLRRLYLKDDLILLLTDDPYCPKIEIEPDMHFSIWGVVRDWIRE